MFLLLSFLLSSRAGTCALPILLSRFSEPSIENLVFDVTTTASTGACAGRSLWDILWSCLATTFACTWVSVHPNIPYIRESKASTRLWRVYLMLVSLIAPEIMILWACKQLQGALVIMKTVNRSYTKVDAKEGGAPETETRTISQDADNLGKAAKASKQKEKDNSPIWTLTHAQYLQMGGYRLQCLTSEEKHIPSRYGRHAKAMFAGGERDVWELPLSFETMKAAFNEGYIDMPFIRKDEILDKNGRDGLSKTIAMLQLTWFIIQIAARIRQGLAVTELELTTAALASLNIAMYISWWSKPTDIMCPTILATKGLHNQDRRWMHNVSLPPSLPEATQATDTARSLPPSPPETTQLADNAHDSSLPPDPKMQYVIDQIGDKERVNLATHYWDEFKKALHDSLKFIVESPAKLVTGVLGFASELGVLIRGIWAVPSSDTNDPLSKASEPTWCASSTAKVRKTISLIWITVTHIFLALIYYPVLAILGSGRRSQPNFKNNVITSTSDKNGGTTAVSGISSQDVSKPGEQRQTGSREQYKPITADDVEDKRTIKLMFSRRALRYVMDMVFFCEDVASAPFSCLSAFAGAVFGIIHCLAWNFEFPSHVEQILWRTCSSVIAGLCVCIMAVALGYIISQNCHQAGSKEEAAEKSGSPDKRTSSKNQSKLTSSDSQSTPTSSKSPGEHASPDIPGEKRSPTIIIDQNCPQAVPSKGEEEASEKPESRDERTSTEVQSKLTSSGDANKSTAPDNLNPGDDSSPDAIEIACSILAICFVLTRISLISLSIIGLRALPASAFETVQWSGFIPHI